MDSKNTSATPEILPTNATKDPTLLDTWDPRLTKELNSLKPHPVTDRYIDSYPGTRTKPMRVLCLGMSRTGTMTLFNAIKKLGYTPYHMAVAMGSPKTNLNLWIEALNAKFNNEGKKWGREEFDKILGNYDGVSDVPCICFVEELVAAYPEAKVILSNRDVDSWLKSMGNTCGVVNAWNWDMLALWDPSLAGPYWEHAKVVLPAQFRTMTDWSPTSPARQAFEDHYELVRRVVPRERLLEYKVQDGWKPLCEFLGVEVPQEELFRVNDAKQFVYVHGLMWWMGFAKMVAKMGAMIAVPALGATVAWWWQSRK